MLFHAFTSLHHALPALQVPSAYWSPIYLSYSTAGTYSLLISYLKFSCIYAIIISETDYFRIMCPFY
jgi:hypothetical protein